MTPGYLKLLIVGLLTSSAACVPSSAENATMSDLRALVIDRVPNTNALAAGTWFMGCKGEGNETVCKECQITLHSDDPEYIAYATLYEHKIRYEDGQPAFHITSDLGSERYSSEHLAAIAPQMVFEMADGWCKQHVGKSDEYIQVKEF